MKHIVENIASGGEIAFKIKQRHSIPERGLPRHLIHAAAHTVPVIKTTTAGRSGIILFMNVLNECKTVGFHQSSGWEGADQATRRCR
jgi:hypothetical protein